MLTRSEHKRTIHRVNNTSKQSPDDHESNMTATKTKRRPKRGAAKKSPKKKPAGIIEAGKAYSLDQFMKTLGCNWHSVREMKRRGLKVRKEPKRVMILGQDYLDYLATLPPSGENHSSTSAGETSTESTSEPGRG